MAFQSGLMRKLRYNIVPFYVLFIVHILTFLSATGKNNLKKHTPLGLQTPPLMFACTQWYSSPRLIRPFISKATSFIRPDFRCTEILLKYYNFSSSRVATPLIRIHGMSLHEGNFCDEFIFFKESRCEWLKTIIHDMEKKMVLICFFQRNFTRISSQRVTAGQKAAI